MSSIYYFFPPAVLLKLRSYLPAVLILWPAALSFSQSDLTAHIPTCWSEMSVLENHFPVQGLASL